MKKILFILCKIIIALPLFSQAGYMGKRFIINADVRVNPAWNRPNYSGEKGFGKFDFIIEPGLEYVIDKKTSVGAVYLNTKGLFPVMINAFGNIILSPGKGESFNISDPITDNKFTSSGFGLFYKYYYGTGSIAPLGKYFKIEFDILKYYYMVNEINIADYVELPLPSSFKGGILYPKENGDGIQMGLKAEFGRDFLLFNYLRLSTGISFGLTFKGFSTGFSNDFGSDKVIFDYSDADKKTFLPSDFVEGQLLRQYWFGLKMGIGIVAF